jgi:hypothetical protein
MSIGQRLDDDELSDVTPEELFRVVGERQTPELIGAPYEVNTDFDIPFGAGNSLDRATIYIDRVLHDEVMDGAFAATGLEPFQIIERFCDHEHFEKAIVDGDNAVDLYYGAHRHALRAEHEGVLAILGRDNAQAKIKTYETVLWPGIERCAKRPVKKVPADLWCAPLRDDEDDPHAGDILKRLLKLGALDAGKRSKYETHYGISGRPCRICRHWHPDRFSQLNDALADCDIVGGLARENRHCDFFKIKKENGERDDER